MLKAGSFRFYACLTAVSKRLTAAKEELKNADKFSYVIENNVVEKAVDELIEIYNKETK